MAPENAVGREQIIPNVGAHENIYVTHEQVVALVSFGHIRYDADYGPNAKVYRPANEADAAKVRSWLG